MRQFNIFQGIYMVFFSRDFYRDVAKHWRGMAVLFLIILASLSSAATILTIDKYVSKFFSTVAPEIIDQVPLLKIKNGRVITPEKKVYRVSYKAGEESFLAIIDTTGKIRSIEESGADILITNSHLVFKKSDNEIRTYSLANAEDMTVTRNDLKGIMDIFDSWYLAIVAPLVILSIVIYKLILMLLYSLIGLVASTGMNRGLDYGAILALTAVAMVPVLVGDIVLELVDYSSGIPWFLGMLITGGYIFFMVHSQEPVNSSTGGETPESL